MTELVSIFLDLVLDPEAVAREAVDLVLHLAELDRRDHVSLSAEELRLLGTAFAVQAVQLVLREARRAGTDLDAVRRRQLEAALEDCRGAAGDDDGG